MEFWNDAGNFFSWLLRWIASAIDGLVYLVVEMAFNVMFDISKVNLFGADLLKEFSQRIYLILGVFMLFKLTMSMINALVNPDKLTDKETGIGKMITRIMIALIMLVMIPTLFQLSRDAQDIFLPIVPKIIIGVNEGDSVKENSSRIGQEMSLTTYRTFVNYNKKCLEFNKWRDDGDGSIGGDLIASGSDLAFKVTTKCPGKASLYLYSYMPIVSAIVGGFLAWILIGFCIDIAVRVFKLGVLELIAPIPIISYIDPKGSKDGAFSTWLKNCTSTYVDVFMKLAIMYFAIFMVGKMATTSGNLTGITNPIIFIFVMIGLFYFAKTAPKFIMDAMGIKGGDGGFLGKMAKTAWDKTGGTALGTLGGAAGGAYAGLRAGGIAGAGAGVALGARSGLKAGWDGKAGKAFGSVGDKILQDTTGDPGAKMGIFGGRKFVDNLNSGQAVKNIKNKTLEAADARNAQRFDKIASSDAIGKVLINQRDSDISAFENDNSLTQKDKDEAINIIRAEYNPRITAHYTAGSRERNKLNDLNSIQENRQKAKDNSDQAKVWAEAIKESQKGGGPTPGAPTPDKK